VTVHRAEEILAEWDAKVARPVLRTPGEVQQDETIADLRKQLREAKAQVTEVQGKFDALATVTAKRLRGEPRPEEEDRQPPAAGRHPRPGRLKCGSRPVRTDG